MHKAVLYSTLALTGLLVFQWLPAWAGARYGGPIVTIAIMFSLALNLAFAGVFMMIVCKLTKGVPERLAGGLWVRAEVQPVPVKAGARPVPATSTPRPGVVS